MQIPTVVLKNIERRFGVNFKREAVFTISIFSSDDRKTPKQELYTPVLFFECNDQNMLGGPTHNLAVKIKTHILQYANETIDVQVQCEQSAVTSIKISADFKQLGIMENFYVCIKPNNDELYEYRP